MIKTLDELRANSEVEISREVEQDEQVTDRIAARNFSPEENDSTAPLKSLGATVV